MRCRTRASPSIVGRGEASGQSPELEEPGEVGVPDDDEPDDDELDGESFEPEPFDPEVEPLEPDDESFEVDAPSPELEELDGSFDSLRRPDALAP